MHPLRNHNCWEWAGKTDYGCISCFAIHNSTSGRVMHVDNKRPAVFAKWTYLAQPPSIRSHSRIPGLRNIIQISQHKHTQGTHTFSCGPSSSLSSYPFDMLVTIDAYRLCSYSCVIGLNSGLKSATFSKTWQILSTIDVQLRLVIDLVTEKGFQKGPSIGSTKFCRGMRQILSIKSAETIYICTENERGRFVRYVHHSNMTFRLPNPAP